MAMRMHLYTWIWARDEVDQGNTLLLNQLAKWIKDSKVTRRDVDSLTSEAGLYSVDPHLSYWFSNLKKASVQIKNLF